MDFNEKKCKIMRITKKKQSFTSNFFLDNSALEEVNEFRDLGLTTHQHLRWSEFAYRQGSCLSKQDVGTY